MDTKPQLKRECKLCKSEKVVIKQTLRRAVKDSVLQEATVLRLVCQSCGYSYRVYPAGVREYSVRTKRLVFLGVVLYSSGLSYEKSAGFLSGMVGYTVEHFVTIWRDIQGLGEKLRRSHIPSQRFRKGATISQVVVGIDGAYVKMKGKTQPVLLASNALTGTTITVALGNEKDEQTLSRFLKQIATTLGVPVKYLAGLTSDDLDTYKIVSEKARLSHQICLAHVKKNTTIRLEKLAKKIPKKYYDLLSSILSPPQRNQGEKLLKQMLSDPKLWKSGKRNKHWVALRRLIGDLLSNWKYYTAYQENLLLPTTNNRTEQAIGRSKIRYPLTRGFKSTAGVLNFFTVTQEVGMKHFPLLAKLC